ncbi:MAG: DNA primase [Bacteroidota bacterium]
MIARSSIDAVINAAAIDEVVGDYIALKKRGANLLGRCPFHDEKTPSFTVSPTKGIYKCFGCGKAGNSVSFLMEHDQLSFSDAIRRLALKYNIELEEDTKQNTEEYNEAQKNRESLMVALEFAKNYFKEQLKTEEGNVAGESYFRERGFTVQTIETFELGYSPQGWESLVDEATRNQFNLDYFVKAGLIKKNEDRNKYFDLFRQRVIFPIHDLTGKVIAFGGRQLVKEEKSPKYLNSPETEVYHKSNVLYGMFQSKKTIKAKNNCYLVEGYTDVITLHQAGITNVVASSGTSLTDGQIRLIKRFTENVTVLYDGDAAGIKASLRGIDLLLAQGLNVRTVSFPEGEDPDSYCRQLGAEAFGHYLETQSKDFILFKIDLLMQGIENDPIRKTDVVKNLLESIAHIPDALKRAAYARECSKLVDTDEKLLLSEINKKRRKNFEGTGPSPVDDEINDLLQTELPKPQQYQTGEEQEGALVRLLIQSGSQKFKEEATVADFIFNELQEDEALKIKHPLYQKILELVQHHMAEQLSISTDFFVNHEDNEIRNLAANLLTENHELSPYWQDNGLFIPAIKDNYIHDLQSVFMFLKLNKINELIKNNLAEFAEAKGDYDKDVCMQYHMQLIAVRNALASLMGTSYTVH